MSEAAGTGGPKPCRNTCCRGHKAVTVRWNCGNLGGRIVLLVVNSSSGPYFVFGEILIDRWITDASIAAALSLVVEIDVGTIAGDKHGDAADQCQRHHIIGWRNWIAGLFDQQG